MNVLHGKNVFVTGGSRGIGREIARACLSAGARVLICSRSADAVDATVIALAEHAVGRIDGVVCDVTKRDNIERALDRLEAEFGPITTLIHAAGVLGPIGLSTEVDPDIWFENVRVNLFGTFLAAREACARMARQGGGRIVMLSGGGAATPFARYSAYASAKAGVVRLAENLALEMAPMGIEVNALAPGMVATGIHHATLEAGDAAGVDYVERTRRMLAEGGFPVEKAAAAAVFLASDAAAGITGRLVSAAWDDWARLPERAKDLGNDLFTLRRIVPRDRGMDWQ